MDDKVFWEKFMEKRKANDPRLQYEIGEIYYWGNCGFEKNPAEAFKAVALSAEKGYMRAQFRLGYCYSNGEGVSEDKGKAKEWYIKAVEQGYAIAQNNLAIIYENEGNYEESKRLFELSAEQGYWLACENIGTNYRNGRGDFEKDLEKTKEYYEKALKNKDFKYALASKYEIDRIKKSLNKVNEEIAENKERLATAIRAERDRVFVSYSHKDAEYLGDLGDHLAMLDKTDKITWWSDREINAGEDFDKEIRENMGKAKVAILLISASFFASEYIWTKELPDLLEAAEKEGATILCLLARNCNYGDTEIGKRNYQFVKPSEGGLVPLAKLSDGEHDDIYTLAARRVKELFKPSAS